MDLAGVGPDGQLPVDGVHRRLRADDVHGPGRAADPGLRRRRRHRRRPRRDPGVPRPAAGHDRLLRGRVRALPVHLVRLDRRRRLGRLRPGDPDPAGLLRLRLGGHRRARAGPPVGRRQRHAHDLARHLAQRGLRDLRAVALVGLPRRPHPAAAVRRRLRDPRHRRLLVGRPGDPGAADLFDAATYDRGAATLQALRNEIGDADFREVLRSWTTENADGSVSTADFVALAERVSGQDLGQFFTDWIDTPAKPPGTDTTRPPPGHPGGGLVGGADQAARACSRWACARWRRS